jgi:CBS domain-containing protein
MSENPVSVRADATVTEAIDLLTRRGYSAAPVIDLSGRAIGVVSRSDVLVHEREQRAGAAAGPIDAQESEPTATRVRDIMTPVVFSVAPDASAAEVVKQMLDWKVQHLFVIDQTGVLIGVISSLDVLKRLHA